MFTSTSNTDISEAGGGDVAQPADPNRSTIGLADAVFTGFS